MRRFWERFKGWSTPAQTWTLVAVIVVLTGALSALGSGGDGDNKVEPTSADAAPARSTTVTPSSTAPMTATLSSEDVVAKPQRVSLSVHRLATTTGTHITVRGRVTSGAEVDVDGVAAHVVGTRFRRSVPLQAGRNAILVRAALDGYTTASKTVHVTRKPKPKPRPKPTPVPETPQPAPDTSQPAMPECDPNYEGACLKPDSPDYDCAGGSGDGPDYTGPVRVVGADPYDLDRDGDGLACESS